MEHFNGILFHESGPASKQHTKHSSSHIIIYEPVEKSKKDTEVKMKRTIQRNMKRKDRDFLIERMEKGKED